MTKSTSENASVVRTLFNLFFYKNSHAPSNYLDDVSAGAPAQLSVLLQLRHLGGNSLTVDRQKSSLVHDFLVLPVNLR